MITDYFEFQDSEIISDFEIQYYNCNIIKSFGDFRPGDNIECLCIDYLNEKWYVYDFDGNEVDFGTVGMQLL